MRRGTIALLATSALITTLACGAGNDGDTEGPGAAQPGSGAAAKGHTIILDVTGPASADITYGTNADQSQEQGAKLPWRKEIPATDLPFATSLLAQSKGTGEIVCTITIDGKVAKTNKSTGQYAVVTCTA